jgi:hypothetical protein
MKKILEKAILKKKTYCVALNFCRSVEKGTDFRVKILIYIIYAILRCDYFHFLSFKLELEQLTLIMISKP